MRPVTFMWYPVHQGLSPHVSLKPERSRNQKWTHHFLAHLCIFLISASADCHSHSRYLDSVGRCNSLCYLQSLPVHLTCVIISALRKKLLPAPLSSFRWLLQWGGPYGGRVDPDWDIMWPRRWLHCVPWPSCAAQLCWRTCGLDQHWDHSHWYPRPSQDLQKGCPCVSVPCGCCSGLARRGSQRHLLDREGEAACKRGQSHTARHSQALETLRCCCRSMKGSGSVGEKQGLYVKADSRETFTVKWSNENSVATRKRWLMDKKFSLMNVESSFLALWFTLRFRIRLSAPKVQVPMY